MIDKEVEIVHFSHLNLIYQINFKNKLSSLYLPSMKGLYLCIFERVLWIISKQSFQCEHFIVEKLFLRNPKGILMVYLKFIGELLRLKDANV